MCRVLIIFSGGGEDARRDKDQFSSPQGWAGHSIADQGLSSPSPHQDARDNVLLSNGHAFLIRVNVLKN